MLARLDGSMPNVKGNVSADHVTLPRHLISECVNAVQTEIPRESFRTRRALIVVEARCPEGV